jgi:hypothetical protein
LIFFKKKNSLLDAEIAKLEEEFDAMDVFEAGCLTREGLTQYFRMEYEKHQKDREGNLEKIMASGLSKSRKQRVGATMKLDPATNELLKSQVDHVMMMDVVGSGKIELHEYARSMAPDIIMLRNRGSRKSQRGQRLSQRMSVMRILKE